jgi:hypothetical protein
MNSVTEANFALSSPLAKHILCRDVAERLPEKEREIFGYDLTKNRIPHETIPNIEILREVNIESINLTQTVPDNRAAVILLYDKDRKEMLALSEPDFKAESLGAFSGLDKASLPIATEKIRSDLDIKVEQERTMAETLKFETDNPLLSGVEYVDTPKGVFIANKTENSIGFCELPDDISRDKAAEVITARLGIENPAAVKECLEKLELNGSVKFAPEQSGLGKLMSYGKEKAAEQKAAKAARTDKTVNRNESPIGGAEGVAR